CPRHARHGDLGFSDLQQELQSFLLRRRPLVRNPSMFVPDTLLYRIKRGRETTDYPDGPPPALPDRHGGALRVDIDKCADGCRACVPVCPTEAIVRPADGHMSLDLGRCIFCHACVDVCPEGAITETADHRMATQRREEW